jgi:hypothetical protein
MEKECIKSLQTWPIRRTKRQNQAVLSSIELKICYLLKSVKIIVNKEENSQL